MSVAEISCRARQEVSKWLDRRAEPRRGRGAIHADLIEQCLEEMPARFFPGPSDSRAAAVLRERCPESALRVVVAADRTLQKRFDLLGYRQLSFGDPIDWHLDPVAGRRAPLLHWSRLDPLDATTVGDNKVVWELNRQQWLVRLGQAYRLTGDERYAGMFTDTIRDWHRANPTGLGINWASSLEVAFRLISWCWSLSFFRGSTALTPRLRADVVAGIADHASRIERYLSHYFSPNTHLTGEALGLFYAGTLFPLLPAAARWQQEAARILIREADRQILPDGVYMEQSTCYQSYTAEIYLHFVILAARNRIPVPEGVVRRLESLLDALVVLRRPDGSLPQIGDADGGRLLPLEPRHPGDASGIFSIAATALKRGDYAWAAGGLTPDVLWLLGTEGAQVFDRLEPSFPAQAPSSVLSDGGYAVLRTGWDREADQVILDGGPLGCRVSGGHGHADLLSVEVSFRGEPYIVDPGTFRYTADEGWRSHYRGTAAHSTVEIDELGQAVPNGPFGWVSRPRARIIRWRSTPELDAVAAEHHAYGRLQDPVVHRRAVFLVKPRYCVIVDDLAGAAEHRVRLRFQFAPMSVTLDPSGWVRAGRGTQKGLLLHAFSTSALKAAILEGETDPKQGWVTVDYGDHQPAPMLVYSVTACLPMRIVTLLLPTDTLLATPPSVSPVTESGWIRGLVFDDGLEPAWADSFPEPPSRP
jgi:hypothetical protein